MSNTDDGRPYIKMVSNYGGAIGGHSGYLILRALAVVFLLRATRQDKFSGRNVMRLKQNLLITGLAGTGKSFNGDKFFADVVGCVNSFAGQRWDGKAPRLIQQDGAMTFEKMRGSASSMGKPIPGAMLFADFINITELYSVVGQGKHMDMKLVAQLGTLFEEGRMTVSLLKLDEMSDEEALEFQKECSKYDGLTFSIQPRGFTIRCNAATVICTTPLDDHATDKLKNNGFLSRFDHISIDMTGQEQMELLRNFGSRTMPDVSKIRTLSEDIWNTEFCAIPYPPADLMDNYALKWFCDEVEAIAQKSNMTPLEVANLREVGNIARLMAASAISRIFEARMPGDRSPVVSIEYTKADADFAMSYLTARLNHLRLDVSDTEKSKAYSGIPQACHDTVSRLICGEYYDEDGRAQAKDIDVEYPRSAFEKIATANGVAMGTVGNWIRAMRKANVVTAGRGSHASILFDYAYALKVSGIKPMHLDEDDIARASAE